ncbi:MAG: type transport system permease protein, partial [Gaiellaceae bacterium]|nr:type transport system permease protein [Gaiellaceae bacterium]
PRIAIGRVTQLHVIRSEWTKLWSLRSTRWSLLVAVVGMAGLGIVIAAVQMAHWNSMSPNDRRTFNPVDVSTAGFHFAQLALGVLGVLVISGEYSTGMIRSSFAAVPKRLPVLWAKAVVFGLVTFALMLPSVLIAFFSSQSILSRHHVDLAWSHPGVARAVVGAALYLTVVAVMTVGIGGIVRNTAGGIAAFASIFFVLPPLMNVLPTSWNDAVSPYLPGNAGRAILSITPDPNSLAPWTGFGLFCGYALATIVAAAILLVRRDT